jgi:ribonuclease D
MDEHVLAAIVADDEAEAFLRVEEFDDAFAFADDLRGHSATGTAAAAAAKTAAASTATAESTAASAAATITVAATAASAVAATAGIPAAAAAAPEAAALLIPEIAVLLFFAKTVAFVAAATAAVPLAPSIETHEPSELLMPALPAKPTRSGKTAQPVVARNHSRTVHALTRKMRAAPDTRIGAGLAWQASAGLKRFDGLAQGAGMTVHFHEEDLSPDVKFADGPVAVDTEAMGLVPGRDRLCLVQLSDGKGDEHLVRFKRGSDYSAPNLKALLADSGRLKLYHFARFDLGMMSAYLEIMAAPVYCTRTASRLVRTYTDRHGLKDLVKELLSIDLSKQQQTSDWGADELSDAQRDYAASDVRYLHALKERLDERLAREERTALAQACFDFLPTRALLDLAGWPEQDIFAHDG